MYALALVAAFLPVPIAAAPVAAAAGPDSSGSAIMQTSAAPVTRAYVAIPAGAHVPFYGDGESETIEAFEFDRYLVTQHDFRRFIEANPQWRRDRVKGAFADDGYLRDWSAPLRASEPAAPVVNVSWFAARAFCSADGARLPTTAEWEYVASASADLRNASRDEAFRALVLEMFTRPRPDRLPAAGSGMRNAYGIYDLHGFVREWVSDFNNVMVSDDSRGTGGNDAQLYCAAAASNARDPADYAAFLRYSLRASLNGRSAQSNVGFRCARSIQ
ncbi:MAG: formylglycine-generating enzyme family protein [Gemmatimonadetes bacterium]|nr:formylglycine-generating enzyme family protein [Gemmatimonadota bacterium]